jgi:SAP domain
MPTVWETAKEKLTKEIAEGRLLDNVPPLLVWPTEPEYQKVPLENFKQNLASLRDRFSNFRISADLDEAALRTDRCLHPVEAEGRWPGSEAESLLKKDIDDGKHLTMSPAELYNHPERSPYKAFPHDQFRKHIHQEVRSRKDNLYWIALKEKGKAKKEEKKAKKEAKRMEEEELIKAGFGGTTVLDLKAECRRRGLKVSGTKAELVDRLRAASAIEG